MKRNIAILIILLSISISFIACNSKVANTSENTINASSTIALNKRDKILQEACQSIKSGNYDIHDKLCEYQPFNDVYYDDTYQVRIKTDLEYHVIDQYAYALDSYEYDIKNYSKEKAKQLLQKSMSSISSTYNGVMAEEVKKTALLAFDSTDEWEKNYKQNIDSRKNMSTSNAPSYSENNLYSKVTDGEELGYAWAIAEQEIKGILKSPTTAKFPIYNNATITKSGNKFKVIGYVDADNSFGAKLRKPFTVEFEKTGNQTYKIINAKLDE